MWDWLPASPFADRAPPTRRAEGPVTLGLEALGQIPMQMVGNVKNLMDAAYTHPMGTSVRDNPQYSGLAAETALNTVGMPALTGGVPAGALGSAAKGIRAYHGSPHDFDRFDLSKIGTGEGAQAYGHGLYFAGNENVAKGYRDNLSKDMFYSPTGRMFDPQSQLQHMNIRVAARNNGTDLDATIARAMQLGDKNTPDATRAMIAHDINVLRGFKDEGGIAKNPGRMYEVNINAKPEQFLDWDKPLAAQRSALQPLAPALEPQLKTAGYSGGLEQFANTHTGADLIDRLRVIAHKTNPGGSSMRNTAP